MELDKNLVKEGGIAALKGAIGAIPFAGTALNEAFFEVRGRIKQERVNSFVNEFAQFIAEADEKDIHLDQIHREDFGDFFEDLLIKISRTRAEQKISAFRNLLANQLLKPKDIDEAELLLTIVASLNEKQVPILKAYAEAGYTSLHVDLSREIIEAEAELARLHKREEELRQIHHMTGETIDDEYAVLRGKITKVQGYKKTSKDQLEQDSGKIIGKNFGHESHVFYYLVQDLCSKGLFLDVGVSFGAQPLDVLEITALGYDVVDFLRSPFEEVVRE